MENEIKVAVGVMIFKDNKVLLIRRQGSHGAGEYAFPGGKLEYGESFEDCIRREVLEETDVTIKSIKFVNVFSSTLYGKHFIILGYTADWDSGEARITEPEKNDYSGWHALDDIPKPFFKHSEIILTGYQTGNKYLDIQK